MVRVPWARATLRWDPPERLTGSVGSFGHRPPKRCRASRQAAAIRMRRDEWFRARIRLLCSVVMRP